MYCVMVYCTNTIKNKFSEATKSKSAASAVFSNNQTTDEMMMMNDNDDDDDTVEASYISAEDMETGDLHRGLDDLTNLLPPPPPPPPGNSTTDGSNHTSAAGVLIHPTGSDVSRV